MELEVIDLDVTQVIEEVAGLLARQAHAKGMELITRGCPGLATRAPRRPVAAPPGAAEPDRQRDQVHRLRARWSCRHSVAATSDDSVDIEFEVSDTGIGISPAHRQRIFQPFTQVDASTTRRFGGTGLGLAISRRLVETMGGDLTVDSRLGAGSASASLSTFPVVVSGPAPPGSRAQLPEGMRVLVVDDNATNRLILHEQLIAWHLDPSSPTAGRPRSGCCTRRQQQALRSPSRCWTSTCPTWTGWSSPAGSRRRLSCPEPTSWC